MLMRSIIVTYVMLAISGGVHAQDQGMQGAKNRVNNITNYNTTRSSGSASGYTGPITGPSKYGQNSSGGTYRSLHTTTPPAPVSPGSGASNKSQSSNSNNGKPVPK